MSALWLPACHSACARARANRVVSLIPEQVSADVPALAAALRKPLRPLWVSQRTRVWLDAAPDARVFPFTPLVLVSASLPGARQRRVVGAQYVWPRVPTLTLLRCSTCARQADSLHARRCASVERIPLPFSKWRCPVKRSVRCKRQRTLRKSTAIHAGAGKGGLVV